jgi:hypothetical protein
MEDIVSPSSEALLITTVDNNEILLMDPKTMGTLETYRDESIPQ